MKKILLVVAATLIPAWASAQFCPGCIQNSATPQVAQYNVSSGTVRGKLTVGELSMSTITASTVTAINFIGSGTYLTNLNAAQVGFGTLPSARISGIYSGITGVGTIADGTWNGAILGSPYGGTGSNLGTAGVGSIPYFSSVGTMSALAPGTATYLLQSNGAAAPSYTHVPQVLGTNVTAIPMVNLIPGQLPTSISVNDASISTVSAAKVIGNIPGNATNITGTLPIGQLGAGTLSTSNPASSVTASGVTPGIWGGPYNLLQVAVGADGRLTSVSQSTFSVSLSSSAFGPLPGGITVNPSQISSGTLSGAVVASSIAATIVTPGSYGTEATAVRITVGQDGRLSFANQMPIKIAPSQISTGTLPTDLNVPAANILSGNLGAGVVASSLAATGVTPGTYGDSSNSVRLAVGQDGRVSFITSFPIEGGASTSTVSVGKDNGWLATQTFFSSITVHSTVGADVFSGSGVGISSIQPANIVAGILPSDVVASSVSLPSLAVPGNISAAAFFGDGSNLTGIGVIVAGSGTGSVVAYPVLSSNTASGNYSNVSGGRSNSATASTSTVSGGSNNTASGLESVVGGGNHNTATVGDATVSGGAFNNSTGVGATISGGGSNNASGTASTISGGQLNTAAGGNGAIGGGTSNTIASGQGNATIGGGSGNNVASGGVGSVIGGGISNASSGTNDTIGGGASNITSGTESTVAGGRQNTASGSWSAVPGGRLNVASGDYSFAGGLGAQATTSGSFVWADSQGPAYPDNGANTANFRAAGGFFVDDGNFFVTNGSGSVSNSFTASTFYGDGSNLTNLSTGSVIFSKGAGAFSVVAYATSSPNTSLGSYSSVLGGQSNATDGTFSTIGGGQANTITNGFNVIGGGSSNSTQGTDSVIGGGYFNFIDVGAGFATISGGEINGAYKTGATVVGGTANAARGQYSTVLGGTGNTANGDYSIAAGFSSDASHLGSTVFSDSQGTLYVDHGTDTFNIRARGGVFVDSATLVVQYGVSASTFSGNGASLTNLTAENISSGNLGSSVIASSVSASGVITGTYGSGTQVPQITVGVDGRVTSISTLTIPSASTSAAYVDVDNSWLVSQTFLAGMSVSGLIQGSSGTFSGTVTASTFNAVGSAYQMNGVTMLSHDREVFATSGTYSSGVTAAHFFGDGSTLTGVVTTASSAGGALTGTYPNPSLGSKVVSSTNVADNTITNQNISTGTFEAITVPASNVAAGSLGSSVIASSVAASGVSSGTYGSSSLIPQITVGVDGRVTAATTVSGSFSPTGSAGGSLSGTYPNPSLGSAVVLSSNIAAGGVHDSNVSLSTGAISGGKFGDDRVAITTGGFSGGFNGASQLVQLTSGGILPVLNGSNLTGISGATESVNASMLGVGTAANPLGVDSSSVAVLSGGLIRDSQINGSSVTKQGNSFNGPSQLLQLDSIGNISGPIAVTSGTSRFEVDPSSAIITVSTSVAKPVFQVRVFGGSTTTMTAIPDNTDLGAFSSSGYDGTTFPAGTNSPGTVHFVSSGTFSSTSHGTFYEVYTTSLNSVTRVRNLVITDTGKMGVATGSAVLSSTLTVGGDVTASSFTGSGYNLTNISISSKTTIANASFTNTTFGVCFATVTMTTRGFPVIVSLVATIQNSNANITMNSSFLIDGAFPSDVGSAALGSSSIAANKDGSMDFIFQTGTISAGSHSFCLTLKTASATGSLLNDSTHYTQFLALERP